VDRTTGLSQLIETRIRALNISQSEAARLAGKGPDGKPALSRSTVSRLALRGLSPPLDQVTIDGLARALQVSRSEIMRAVVVTLGLGRALPDISPEMYDLLLRVSDLPDEQQEMWLDMAAALATVLSHREAGVRQPVHASSTTRRAGGGTRRRDRGYATADGIVDDLPDLSADEQQLLDDAEQAGRDRWDEEHGR
jgi:transcriptional regulator with XRE-family HTH domain